LEKERMRERLTSVHSMTRRCQRTSIAEFTAGTVISRHSWETTWDAKFGSAILSGEKTEKSGSSVGKMRASKCVSTWLFMTIDKLTKHNDPKQKWNTFSMPPETRVS
jgi:hypothetical protein